MPKIALFFPTFFSELSCWAKGTEEKSDINNLDTEFSALSNATSPIKIGSELWAVEFFKVEKIGGDKKSIGRDRGVATDSGIYFLIDIGVLQRYGEIHIRVKSAEFFGKNNDKVLSCLA